VVAGAVVGAGVVSEVLGVLEQECVAGVALDCEACVRQSPNSAPTLRFDTLGAAAESLAPTLVETVLRSRSCSQPSRSASASSVCVRHGLSPLGSRPVVERARPAVPPETCCSDTFTKP
jgi:hypothetical protein